MLCFVGLGINGYAGLSLLARETLKKCQFIYIERFTGYIDDDDIRQVKNLLEYDNKSIQIVPRWFIEDAKSIISRSKDNNVAILTYGDPFMATTFNELYVRAKKNLIEIKIIHGVSGISSLIGEIGLHNYKFGRTTTIMSDPMSAISVYNTIYENLRVGNHTLILTEYNNNNEKSFFFLDPARAIDMLLEVEGNIRYKIISDELFIIVASRIGTKDQNILGGKVKSIKKIDFGKGPHSIIVTGHLHFTEIDSITSLYPNKDPPLDNTQFFRHVAVTMLEKYLPKAKDALKNMKSYLEREKNSASILNAQDKEMDLVLENAEYYLWDAERFFNQHKFELGILSIGYAEGLIDALRFQKNINPWLS
ncbi:MAG TPA: diphthine synthase [Nitrososphaeraceae archaeon]|nr:diphthine synthase [Nitrososphaeraceae archaeon]